MLIPLAVIPVTSFINKVKYLHFRSQILNKKLIMINVHKRDLSKHHISNFSYNSIQVSLMYTYATHNNIKSFLFNTKIVKHRKIILEKLSD